MCRSGHDKLTDVFNLRMFAAFINRFWNNASNARDRVFGGYFDADVSLCVFSRNARTPSWSRPSTCSTANPSAVNALKNCC